MQLILTYLIWNVFKKLVIFTPLSLMIVTKLPYIIFLRLSCLKHEPDPLLAIYAESKKIKIFMQTSDDGNSDIKDCSFRQDLKFFIKRLYIYCHSLYPNNHLKFRLTREKGGT